MFEIKIHIMKKIVKLSVFATMATATVVIVFVVCIALAMVSVSILKYGTEYWTNLIHPNIWFDPIWKVIVWLFGMMLVLLISFIPVSLPLLFIKEK